MRRYLCIGQVVQGRRGKIGSDKTEELGRRREKLIVSAVVLTECARAFKKAGYNNGEIYEILDMLDAFNGLCGVDVVPVDWLIIKSAQSLVVDYNLYSADAIHAATAMLTESDFFVSNDEHHFHGHLKSHLDKRNVRLLRLSEVEQVAG